LALPIHIARSNQNTIALSQLVVLLFPSTKKNHTLKNQFIVTPNGREIVDIIVAKPGLTSDINIWRTSQSKLGFTQRFKGDKASVQQEVTLYKRSCPDWGLLTIM